jgi:hypothetical protein
VPHVVELDNGRHTLGKLKLNPTCGSNRGAWLSPISRADTAVSVRYDSRHRFAAKFWVKCRVSGIAVAVVAELSTRLLILVNFAA